MAKAAATRGHLYLLLFLFFPLWSSLPKDTHPLSCNIIVKTNTIPGQPWLEGQYSMNGMPFLQYDNINKATPLGDKGEMVPRTPLWTDLIKGLENLGQELRKMLANTKLETTQSSGHPTLQTTMISQYEQGKIIGASCQFNISGKYSFILDTMNMNWTPFNLEAKGIINEWKNDEELVKYLKIFMADLDHHLKELLKRHKENLSSALRPPNITELTSATQLPPTLNTTKIQSKEVLTSVGLIFITIAFILCMYMKRRSHT